MSLLLVLMAVQNKKEGKKERKTKQKGTRQKGVTFYALLTMKNDLEKMLEKVVVPTVPVKGWGFLLGRFNRGSYFKNVIKRLAAVFRRRSFGVRYVAISGFVTAGVLILFFALNGGSSGPVEIKKAESVKYSDRLIAEVSKLIVLPDEKPIIATIADFKPLEKNGFFKGAGRGDKLLIFSGADKVILYDPEAGRILNTGKAEEAGIKF